jgi:metal-sulfur cluster biosynthetic enzyme
MTQAEIKEAIVERLQGVIDPETGADVWRMRLVEELVVSEAGCVRYRFRPSSPLCPIAVPLAQAIKAAIDMVPGVTDQEVQVVGYMHADLLTRWLNEQA